MDLDEFVTCVKEAASEEEIEACVENLPPKEYDYEIAYGNPDEELKKEEGTLEEDELVGRMEMLASKKTPLVSVEAEPKTRAKGETEEGKRSD